MKIVNMYFFNFKSGGFFFFFNLNILFCIISCIGFTKQDLVKIESKHSI